jgi:hypothetical protein
MVRAGSGTQTKTRAISSAGDPTSAPLRHNGYATTISHSTL